MISPWNHSRSIRLTNKETNGSKSIKSNKKAKKSRKKLNSPLAFYIVRIPKAYPFGLWNFWEHTLFLLHPSHSKVVFIKIDGTSKCIGAEIGKKRSKSLCLQICCSLLCYFIIIYADMDGIEFLVKIEWKSSHYYQKGQLQRMGSADEEQHTMNAYRHSYIHTSIAKSSLCRFASHHVLI